MPYSDNAARVLRMAIRSTDNLTGPESSANRVRLQNELSGGRMMSPYVPEHIPPGVDIRDNCHRASEMNLLDFYLAIRNKGEWDYKQRGPQYENFGNWHAGLMAACAGIPRDIFLRAAGLAQQLAGTSQPQWGTPQDKGTSSYGDDPKDQKAINMGFDAFDDYKNQLQKKDYIIDFIEPITYGSPSPRCDAPSSDVSQVGDSMLF